MAKVDWKGRESFPCAIPLDEPLESLSFRERGGGGHLCLMQRNENDIYFAVNNFKSCTLGHFGSAAKQTSLYMTMLFPFGTFSLQSTS